MTSSNYKSPLKAVLLYLGMAIGAVIVMISISGCTDTCETTTTYVTFQPLFASMADLRTEVSILPPQEREGQGKIYIYGDYLLLGDPGKGIHVYNNADPANPTSISFINIPGNMDMAIRDGNLYVDSYVDLLVFDFNDPVNIAMLTRIEDAFPLYNNQFGMLANGDQIITGFEELETVEISTDCSNVGPDLIFMAEDVVAFNTMSPQLNIATGPAIGTGGSMARFTIVENTLYAVDDMMMHVFDIQDGANPINKNSFNLGWGIETIFPFKNNLFIGSMNGMSIYNIDDPINPSFMSEVSHIRTCDPVVANDDYAFVTLRSENDNNFCGTTFTNELDVIDISDITRAKLLHVYPMTEPYGLGIDGDLLFITEGDAGLKIFNIANVAKIDENLIQHITGFNAFDVIPNNGVLILTGKDGLYQFDYSNIDEVKMLSLIPAAVQ